MADYVIHFTLHLLQLSMEIIFESKCSIKPISRWSFTCFQVILYLIVVDVYNCLFCQNRIWLLVYKILSIYHLLKLQCLFLLWWLMRVIILVTLYFFDIVIHYIKKCH